MSENTEEVAIQEAYPIFGKYGRGRLAQSIYRRAAFSVSLVISLLAAGTIAFHYIEHYSWVTSFYFVSMLATAEGPPFSPVTALGQIVASIFAFVSIGSVIFALAFIFGPFIARLARASGEGFKKEEERIKKAEKSLGRKIAKYEKRL